MDAGIRILVVDDEPDLCFLYREALRDEGYDVETAANGPRALDEFARFHPDLVVMDIRMPGMDGIETMGHLLSIKRDLPIILNTAWSCHKDNFCTWPASAYVVKSSDLSELTRSIRTLLDETRRARSVSQAA